MKKIILVGALLSTVTLMGCNDIAGALSEAEGDQESPVEQSPEPELSIEVLAPNTLAEEALTIDTNVRYRLAGENEDEFYMVLNPGVYRFYFEDFTSVHEYEPSDTLSVDLYVRNDDTGNYGWFDTLLIDQSAERGAALNQFLFDEVTYVRLNLADFEDSVANSFKVDMTRSLLGNGSSYDGTWMTKVTSPESCGIYTSGVKEEAAEFKVVGTDAFYVGTDRYYSTAFVVDGSEITYDSFDQYGGLRPEGYRITTATESRHLTLSDGVFSGTGKFTQKVTLDGEVESECSVEYQMDITIS